MLIPEEVFKRRRQHNNTPESVMLIITNFIVISVAEVLFTGHHHINWFFWVVAGLLAVYNVFSIRRNHEVYSRVDMIAYVAGLVVMVILVVMLYFLQ